MQCGRGFPVAAIGRSWASRRRTQNSYVPSGSMPVAATRSRMSVATSSTASSWRISGPVNTTVIGPLGMETRGCRGCPSLERARRRPEGNSRSSNPMRASGYAGVGAEELTTTRTIVGSWRHALISPGSGSLSSTVTVTVSCCASATVGSNRRPFRSAAATFMVAAWHCPTLPRCCILPRAPASSASA
jgi:hypothetical protein